MTFPIRVLIVDDSAFMRKVIANMLSADSRISVVGTARNGDEAAAQVKALKPDVMTLDIEMPGLNGLDVLRHVMKEMPLPVIMVSSLTEEGAKETLTALDLGAVDYIPKHLQGSAVNIVTIQQNLIEKVVMAHQVGPKLAQFGRRASREHPVSPILPLAGSSGRGHRMVAIGCSTGGPKALQEILPLFPKDFPAPILVVQHMPKFFVGPFAQRLNELSQIEVREAVEGDVLRPGLALIAPGGVQIKVARRNTLETVVKLSAEPVTLHMPSVDVMMMSAAQIYPERVIGVILTGMGYDGMEGMAAIKKANGRTIAQDEATSVVYGMPKAVVDSGTADKIVPLDQIAGEIANMV
jgi:two-component system, chemotaxis family, protein-glutamate methylesterase/glutaminase